MPRVGVREILLASLVGVLLGLAVAIILWSGPVPGGARDAPEPSPAPTALDTGAERSQAILEARETAPPRTLVSEAARAQAAGVRVIDGDTFDYRGMRVRIADIDTPEVEGRCPREMELAGRATRRMRALLGAGPFELRRPPNGRDEDRYGRKLRIVIRDGRSLGDQLVAEGLARTWTGRREPWC